MNTIRACLWVFCVSLLSQGGPAFSETFVLVKDGAARCRIVLGRTATPPECHAASELRQYVRKISGADLPEVSGMAEVPSSFSILMGTPDSLPAIGTSGLLPRIQKLSDEGFVLKTDRKGLIVAAKKPMGVLYGTYTFLEGYLGVRWFFPGEEGEFCPRKPSIVIGRIDDVEIPAFVVRTLNLTCTNINARLVDTWDWMVRNKMQLRTPSVVWSECGKELAERGAIIEGGGHCLAYLVPQDAYFKEHPEYYPLINGKRTPCFPKEGGLYQLCTSNPEVIEIAAKGIISFFKSRPEARVYAVGNNDGDGWCECKACRALDDPWERKQGFVTARFYRFVNAVAERVLKECPDRTVNGWGYQLFRTAPRGVKPDPRLELMVALHGRCYRHSLGDPTCPVNTNLRGVLKEWLVFGNLTGTYDYYSCFINDYASPPYVPLENVVAGDVKCQYRLGGRYWRAEVPPPDGVFGKAWDNPFAKENWRSQLLTYYLAAKLLWNPDQDVERLKADFFRMYYGPASQPMRRYREMLSAAWETTEGHFIYGNGPRGIGKALAQPGREEELLGYLSLAEKSAASSPQALKRISAEREFFNAVWHRAFVELQRSATWEDVEVAGRKGPIAIDGTLDEKDWSAANTVTGFYNPNTNALAQAQTFVKMLFDGDFVYFGIACMEPSMATMKTRYTQRDEEVWRDDDVELFIDPDKSGKTYFHFALNAKGTIYDTRCELGGLMDRGFNADCQAACKSLEDRWVLEMRIKAASLNAQIAEGKGWKVNVARNRHGLEASTWTDGAFHQPASFRAIVFGGDSLVRNGGFEKVVEITTDEQKRFHGWTKGWITGNDPLLFPLNWSLHDNYTGKLTIVDRDLHSGRHACKVEKGWIASYFPASTGEKLHIEFWAKGEKLVSLMLFQYRKTAEGTIQFVKTDSLAAVELSPAWKRYTFDHEVTTEQIEQVGLAFGVNEALVLDDVEVTKSR